MIDYQQLLKDINNRMAMIMDVSLEEEVFNQEWLELSKMKDSAYRLLKIKKEQEDK